MVIHADARRGAHLRVYPVQCSGVIDLRYNHNSCGRHIAYGIVRKEHNMLFAFRQQENNRLRCASLKTNNAIGGGSLYFVLFRGRKAPASLRRCRHGDAVCGPDASRVSTWTVARLRFVRPRPYSQGTLAEATAVQHSGNGSAPASARSAPRRTSGMRPRQIAREHGTGVAYGHFRRPHDRRSVRILP